MGSLDVLSAVIVGCMMLSAIAYVSTFDAPETTADRRIDSLLEQSARDFLHMYDEWPLTTPCKGNTMLERFLIEGLNGDDDEWRRRVATQFPIGTDVSLLLDNGEGIYPLQERWKAIGSTYDLTFQPDWDYVLALPTVGDVDGASNLVADVFASRHSTLLSPRGEALEMTVTVASATTETSLRANAVTATLPLTASSRVDAALAWVDNEAQTEAFVAFQPIDLVRPVPRTFRLHLESSGAPLPVGFVLEVDLPAGWQIADIADPQWSQTNSANPLGTTTSRFTTLAEIALPIEFSFSATPPTDPHRPFDVITARASHGSLSQTHLPVIYGVEVESDLPRELLPITTYPVARGGTGLFGGTFVNGGPDVEVSSFEVAIPGGYDLEHNEGAGANLFAMFTEQPATHGTVQGGAWTWIDERHVRWVPAPTDEPLVVPRGGVASWLVELPINASDDLQTGIEPLHSEGAIASLGFENGFVARSSVWGPTPGIVRVRVPPDDPATPDAIEGYPWTRGEELATHPFEVESSIPWARIAGEGAYSLRPGAAHTVDMESALAGASFRVRDRLAPLGSFVEVDADLTSVATELASAGVDGLSLTVDMYAPPSMGCKPTSTITLDQGTLPTSASPAASLWDADGLGHGSLFVVNEDGHAYRIDGTDAGGGLLDAGAQRWASELPGPGTALALARSDEGSPMVIAGDGLGTVTVLDALTGMAGGEPILVGAGGVQSILVDEREQRFVTSTSGGDVQLRRLDGTLVAAWRAPLLDEGRVRSAPRLSWGPGGDVVAITPSEVYRLRSDDLEQTGGFGLVAYAATVHDGIGRVLGIDGVYELDYESFSGLRRIEERALLAGTAADLDGDAILDLVGVDADMTLHAWRGSDGAPWWRSGPEYERAGEIEATLVAVRGAEAGSFCASAQIETYEIRPMCELTPDPLLSGGEADTVFAMAAGVEGVALGYRLNGVVRVAAVDADGAGRWDRDLKSGVLPVALARGQWGATRAVLVSGDDGVVRIFDPDAATPGHDEAVYEGSPSKHVGAFRMFVPVPGGGFYGAHLLVATLSWTDGQDQTQQAKLNDWFNVVGGDGKPVVEPAYRVVLVVGQSQHAVEEGAG